MKSEKECGAILLSFQMRTGKKKKWRNSHISESIIKANEINVYPSSGYTDETKKVNRC